MGFSFAARSIHTNRGCTAVERYFAAIRGVCVAGFVFLQRVEKRIIAVDCSFYARLSACNPATSVCRCVGVCLSACGGALGMLDDVHVRRVVVVVMVVSGMLLLRA